ncbi:MAG: TolC family protein [Acidobacteriia bacterium]|nr:TolC family protein [Terriglobia bacterium]
MRHSTILAIGMMVAFTVPHSQALAQTTVPAGTAESQLQLLQPPGPGQSAPPITVTLQDALERARKNDPGYLSAVSDAKSAHEDSVQARAALLPSVNASVQYLGTQGNGGLIPDGRYVTNDGVHVYRAWGVFHQDLSPGTFMATGLKKARAAEALAKAKAEIARRGLTVTVSKDFYALVVAQRKYATAQQAIEQAKHFLDITQASEREGESPHSDTVQAEIQYRLQAQAFDEAKLMMEDARLILAVILFPTLNENFSVVDDLDSAQALPAFAEVQTMAEKENPDLRVAIETARESDLDVRAAKTAFFPTLVVDTDYGIEANCFSLRCPRAGFREVGPVPNLGYFVTAALTIPVWDWGTLRSKLHQAEYKQQTAKATLSLEQRLRISELYAAYNEATVARTTVDASRHTAELAAEGLRLINLRYVGGASGVLDVVHAQDALLSSRNAYIDAQARYRAALATLQTLTGSF